MERKDDTTSYEKLVGHIKYKGWSIGEEYEIGEGKFSIEDIKRAVYNNEEVESAEIIKLTISHCSEVVEKIK
jgi:hypothetical protein